MVIGGGRVAERKAKMLPTFLSKDMTDQVILMEALHDQNDPTCFFIVEPRIDCAVIPLVTVLSFCF